MKALLARGSHILGDRDTRDLIRRAPLALIVRGLGGIAQIIVSVLLARALGAEGLGVYVLAFTIATIASTIGRLGLETSAIRLSAQESARQGARALLPLYKCAWRITFVASSLSAIVLLLVAPRLSTLLADGANLTEPVRWMALGVIPLSLSLLQVGFLRGVKRASTAAAAETLGVPFILSCAILATGSAVGVTEAAVLTDVSIVIVYILSSFAWRRTLPKGVSGRADNVDARRLLLVGIPVFWTSAMNYVMQFAPTVIVGSFAGPIAAGVYALAMRLSLVSNVIGSAVSTVAAPQFAIQMADGDMKALGKLGRRSTAAMTALSMPLLVPMLFAGGWIMGIFGEAFRQGAATLAVLAVGQLIQIVTGAVGYVLVMTGHEREMRTITVVCTTFFIALNLVLVPAFGILGAAVAYSTGMLVLNVWKTLIVYKRLGVILIPGVSHKGLPCAANV